MKTETKINWKRVTYVNRDFRQCCKTLEEEHNLSRFIWRVAKTVEITELTKNDVKKILQAADETIWILNGSAEFERDEEGNETDGRAPTWIRNIEDIGIWKSLMRIQNAGLATSYLKEITIGKEKRQQRVWKLQPAR